MFIHTGTFFEISFSDGILSSRLIRDMDAGSKEAWEWINCLQDMRDQIGRSYPLLTTVNVNVNFDSEARRVIGQLRGVGQLYGQAFCVDSLAKKAMLKFLMVLVPGILSDIEVFLQEEAAVQWLVGRSRLPDNELVREHEARALKISIDQGPRMLDL